MAATRKPTPEEREARCIELAHLMKAGSEEAMAELMTVTKPLVRNELLTWNVTKHHDQEDIMQSAYAALWEHRHTMRVDKVVAYLRIIVRNAARWYHKTRKRRPDVLVLDPTITPTFRADPAPGPDEALLAAADEQETAKRWAPMIDALPAHLQEVIRYRLNGYSPEATAQLLSLSIMEVWDRLLDGTALLRQAAGLPVENRWLGAKLMDLRLCHPGRTTVESERLVRGLTPYMRRAVYQRLAGEEWHRIAGLTETQRLSAKRTLREARKRLGIPTAPSMEYAMGAD